MLSAAIEPLANVVPARTSVAGRALQIVLFLGGFLMLAFILSAQAHAASPHNQSVKSASAPRPTLVVSLERGTERSVKAGKAQADRSVDDTVAAATAGDAEQPTTGLIDTVHDVTQQVTDPVTEVIGSIGAGHSGSTPGPGGGHGSASRTHDPLDGAWFLSASRATGHPAGTSAGQHGRAGHGNLVTPLRAPGQLPSSAQFNEHPVESDGGAQHTGGAYAAFFAGGARVHLGAVVMPSAHGSVPLRRTPDVSVNPD